MANVMINARVGPLLKKVNIHQKNYFFCMKTYWISPERRLSSSRICTKAKRRYILAAFVVNNPTCTKPCMYNPFFRNGLKRRRALRLRSTSWRTTWRTRRQISPTWKGVILDFSRKFRDLDLSKNKSYKILQDLQILWNEWMLLNQVLSRSIKFSSISTKFDQSICNFNSPVDDKERKELETMIAKLRIEVYSSSPFNTEPYKHRPQLD